MKSPAFLKRNLGFPGHVHLFQIEMEALELQVQQWRKPACAAQVLTGYAGESLAITPTNIFHPGRLTAGT